MSTRRRGRPARKAGGGVYLLAVIVSVIAATLLVTGGIPTRVLWAVL
ncbi:MAG TPA: hypothetical protein VGE70_09730 [Burkholderiaceae bacterium]